MDMALCITERYHYKLRYQLLPLQGKELCRKSLGLRFHLLGPLDRAALWKVAVDTDHMYQTTSLDGSDYNRVRSEMSGSHPGGRIGQVGCRDDTAFSN